MEKEVDILCKMYDEQWVQARHIENQRSTITNIVIVIASAILGLIAQKGIGMEMLPVTILLIVLGLYGAISSEKLYERFNFCVNRAVVIRKKIESYFPSLELTEFNKEFESMHIQDFSILSKIRLHYLWLFLHLLIITSGATLTTIIFFL